RLLPIMPVVGFILACHKYAQNPQSFRLRGDAMLPSSKWLAVSFAFVLPAGFLKGTVNGLGSQTQGEITGGYYVGSISWSQSGNSSVPWAGNPTFYTFCIETSQDVYLGGTYTYQTRTLNDAPIPGAGMGTSKAIQISRMWAADHASLGTDPTKNAAFQVAIWDILGESIPFTVNSTLQNQANTYIADSTTSGPLANLVALTNGSSQDQIMELGSGWSVTPDGNIVGAPVPPSSLLALSGLLPVAGYVRLRRRSAA